jgi:pimeloyl-ACP methyl ester carboxylesterase
VPAEQVALPGRVVAAGGRVVHLVEKAGAEPAVLLLGGCGVPYYAWDPVVRLLGERRAVSMDRPGIGGTPWPGRLPTLAEELDTLIDVVSAMERPPIVVAHSMAGLHAEGLIRSRPGLVGGLVLVDASVDHSPRRVSNSHRWRRLAQATDQMMRAVPPSRALGSFADRLLTTVQSERLRLTTPRPPVQRAVYRSPDAVASVIAEQAAYEDQLLDLVALRVSLRWPGTPVHVLTAALVGGADWVRAQAALADVLNGVHTMVPGSRHLIMVDRPDAIADAVQRLTT